VLFVLGCVLQGLALVLDQAFMGLLRSNLFLARNVSFALAKLVHRFHESNHVPRIHFSRHGL
jgi:hypothetical protein